ncbi:MAG TPA: AAA family ATPase [Gammaproteobacteria bacterium]
MPSRYEVCIVSRSKDSADQLYACLSEAHDLQVEKRAITNGDMDPLRGMLTMPDLLVLHIGSSAAGELDVIAGYSPDERPPLIVVGDGSDARAMRAAMHAGARDFLAEPIAEEDLLSSVRRFMVETQPSRKKGTMELISFINSKGGSGATFLATNLAHMLAAVSNRRTALLDLDLQFGTLPQYLDLKPKRGLMDALEVADDLDSVALEAYMTRHESGLSVLAALNSTIDVHQEPMLDAFDRVLELLAITYERIVVDLPRHIDSFAAITLERSDRIAIVVQQSVPSLQDAVRVYNIATKELAIPRDRLTVVVNRKMKNAAVEIADIEQALHGIKPVVVPNDFQGVAESVNIGVPIYELSRRSQVTKSLLRLVEDFDGRTIAKPKGLISRLRGASGQV